MPAEALDAIEKQYETVYKKVYGSRTSTPPSMTKTAQRDKEILLSDNETLIMFDNLNMLSW